MICRQFKKYRAHTSMFDLKLNNLGCECPEKGSQRWRPYTYYVGHILWWGLRQGRTELMNSVMQLSHKCRTTLGRTKRHQMLGYYLGRKTILTWRLISEIASRNRNRQLTRNDCLLSSKIKFFLFHDRLSATITKTHANAVTGVYCVTEDSCGVNFMKLLLWWTSLFSACDSESSTIVTVAERNN